jgi:glycosyltransferase involved in cell wall biosynthesis
MEEIMSHTVPIKNEPYAITVCRIEPENNIHLILDAFSKQTKLPLLIIGNWENSAYGENLLEKYKDASHIHLLEPIYEADKINSLRSNAYLYVHGHSAGGTNPSLVEAMSLSLPVFAFDCIYNRYTTENKCIYWNNANELYLHISQCKKTSLDNLGMKMKSIADSRYKWNDIISKYESLF